MAAVADGNLLTRSGGGGEVGGGAWGGVTSAGSFIQLYLTVNKAGVSPALSLFPLLLSVSPPDLFVYIQTASQARMWASKPTERQTDGQTDRQTDRQKDR